MFTTAMKTIVEQIKSTDKNKPAAGFLLPYIQPAARIISGQREQPCLTYPG
jgi:hypothetical protein